MTRYKLKRRKGDAEMYWADNMGKGHKQHITRRKERSRRRLDNIRLELAEGSEKRDG